jgi:predicted Zn-dependent protease
MTSGAIARLSAVAMQAIRAGDWPRAEQALRRLVKERGTPAEAAYNLAQVLLHRGRGEQAGPWLRRAVAQRPDYAIAWFELGRWTLLHGALDEARDAFARAAALAPEDADAWRNLARIAERLGDFATARDAWARLADPEARVGLLRALLELRDPAAEPLRQALWVEPALRPLVLRAITATSAGRLPLDARQA